MAADETQLLYSLCLHGRGELGLAPDEYVALTMVLLRLLAFKPGAMTSTPAEKKSPRPAPEPLKPVVAQVPPVAQVANPVPAVAAHPAPSRLPPQPAPAPVAGAGAVAAPAQDDGPPPWVDLDDEEPYVADIPAEVGLDAPPFQALPVRETSAPSARTAPRRDAPERPAAVALIPTEEGEFWAALVREMVTKELINALVRELALQSQLLGRDTDRWQLRLERESLNQPAARERLKAALSAMGHAVELGFELGKVSDSPWLRNTVAANERQWAAQALIENDPLVQAMLRDFGGKIVPDSVQPI